MVLDLLGQSRVLARGRPHRLLRNLIGLVFAQWLFLLGMSFLPFGLALVRSGTPASTLFGGSFLRSWGALPVPREP